MLAQPFGECYQYVHLMSWIVCCVPVWNLFIAWVPIVSLTFSTSVCGGWGANGFHRRTKISELNVSSHQFAQFLVPNKTSLGSPECITLQLAYGFARLKIYFKWRISPCPQLTCCISKICLYFYKRVLC